MAKDPFRKVHLFGPNVVVDVAPEAYNAFVDAARQTRRGQGTPPPAGPRRTERNIVLVHNVSGSALDRFDAVGISGPVIKPSVNESEFVRVPLSVVTPAREHVGRFVVLLEPIANDSMGYAQVDGVCAAIVDVVDEAHTHAEIAVGETRLATAAEGSARILWLEPVEDRSDPAVAWAIVQLAGGRPGWWAQITGWAPLGSMARWKYAHREVYLDDNFDVYVVAGGISGTTSSGFAINMAEVGNTVNDPADENAGWQMPGVDMGAESFPSGFKVQPIGGDNEGAIGIQGIVWMREERTANGTPFYCFDKQNAFWGTECEVSP